TDRIRKQFEDVNAIIFGHTHNPLNEEKEGIIFFNPGSPFDTIYAPFNSIGIIHIEDTLKGQIIRL
ncbi:MAG: metallophosphoesterase family protein, partial [Candidatus Aenigmatarchaeota archaeon]